MAKLDQIEQAGGDNTLDIFGFSRGGVEAIEFANRVAQKYPNIKIRFVGLFDPVAALGPLGGLGSTGSISVGFRLSLPPGIKNVYEALALNENRAAFNPLILAGATQQWFKGTHRDIGGGAYFHGLSDITLGWMIGNAQQAGLSFDTSRLDPYNLELAPNPAQAISTNPSGYGTNGSGPNRGVIQPNGNSGVASMFWTSSDWSTYGRGGVSAWFVAPGTDLTGSTFGGSVGF